MVRASRESKRLAGEMGARCEDARRRGGGLTPQSCRPRIAQSQKGWFYNQLLTHLAVCVFYQFNNFILISKLKRQTRLILLKGYVAIG